MNITLKNIQHAAFASEETDCFKATVYIDGKKVGTVSNDGHGGCNMYEPWQIGKTLNEYGKTLPPIPVPGAGGHTIQPTADCLIHDAMVDQLMTQDLKKALKTRVLFLENGKIMQSKKCTAAAIAKWISAEQIVKTAAAYKVPVKAILNALPFDEALALYKEAMKRPAPELA
jgi:hypothetical protein